MSPVSLVATKAPPHREVGSSIPALISAIAKTTHQKIVKKHIYLITYVEHPIRGIHSKGSVEVYYKYHNKMNQVSWQLLPFRHYDPVRTFCNDQGSTASLLRTYFQGTLSLKCVTAYIADQVIISVSGE